MSAQGSNHQERSGPPAHLARGRTRRHRRRPLVITSVLGGVERRGGDAAPSSRRLRSTRGCGPWPRPRGT
jgi:hypothetical protein